MLGRPGADGRPQAGRRVLRNPRRNGDRATRDELYRLAERFHLEIITIEQLIRSRRLREKLVYRVAEADLPTTLRPRPDHRLRGEVRRARSPWPS